MNNKRIIAQLPYSKPFLFVDELLEIHGNGSKGTFTFTEDLAFYRGHFKDRPVTPGAILTECCAQIGVVCLGIYLLEKADGPLSEDLQIALSSTVMEFLLPVYPGEAVTVSSEKCYFRFQKLKCTVQMHNGNGELGLQRGNFGYDRKL